MAPARFLPQAKSSHEGIGVVARSAPWRELFQLLDVASSQNHVLRFQSSNKAGYHVCHELRSVYGGGEVSERYYCHFGLNPAYRDELEAAGLRVAGVDASDGDVRIMRLAGHPFFVLTLFVPQSSSSLSDPHPLIVAFLRAAAGHTALTPRPGRRGGRELRTAPAGLPRPRG